jgi:hypothetical protein
MRGYATQAGWAASLIYFEAVSLSDGNCEDENIGPIADSHLNTFANQTDCCTSAFQP